mmetsp:Transcript_44469/g.43135  ORF Transcript_44469/g.43135 Transcript_44469/m.43135 type:complete len:101 (+) Transcript_44469:140-442(+)
MNTSILSKRSKITPGRKRNANSNPRGKDSLTPYQDLDHLIDPLDRIRQKNKQVLTDLKGQHSKSSKNNYLLNISNNHINFTVDDSKSRQNVYSFENTSKY